MSWYYLLEHCKVVKLEAEITALKYADKSIEEIEKKREELKQITWKMEEKVDKTFDLWHFTASSKLYF